MRRIAVAALKPGTVLGRPLLDGSGEVVVGVKRPLNADQIKQLRALGVATVYIQDQRTDDLEPPELVGEDVRVQIVRGLRTIFRGVAEHAFEGEGTIDPRGVERIVQMLLGELQRTKHILAVSPMGSRVLADFEYHHAIGCAELAVRLGMLLDKSERILHDICAGALLQNVGKFLLPGLDLSRPGALSPEAQDLLRTHPTLGFKLVKRSRFEPTVSAIVLQHHERLDGTGYPEGRRGHDIYLLAQIVGLADTYHALISNRPHRGPYVPHLAIELLMSHAGIWCRTDLIKALLQMVPPYDIGMTVRLSSGAVGVVVDPKIGFQARPIVRLFTDESGARLPDLPEVDLSDVQNLNLVVTEVVDA